MSRSAPTANNPHPCSFLYEWRGGDGILQHYDKEKNENVQIKLPFTFIVLDRLARVGGYSEKHQTGYFSNEVRDTRTERLVVRDFKTRSVIAEGYWAEIKDKVTARDGKFILNVYNAFKDPVTSALRLGCFTASGCSLGPWFDLEKANRKQIEEQAVTIKPGPKQKVGRVEFIPPMFTLKDISPETNKEAIEMDKFLQEFYKEYFKRPSAAPVRDEAVQQDPPDDPGDHVPEAPEEPPKESVDEDIPY